ncbi:GTPase domain-containing protein [candidate division KSB1 bacterium]|nr:GTPase domain-containing protein [candidate division KSB1 bacterium]
MRVINGQIYLKILFFGTALAGKTTTLNWIYHNLIPQEMKTTNNIRSVTTSFGQTMLFDFVPVKVSDNIHIRFFTATGQDYYAGTRKMLFQDVDGVFFVVDSQKKELEHNREFVNEFNRHINTFFENVENLIVVVLFNKQDLPEIYPAEFLARELNLDHFSGHATCSLTGENIKSAFFQMITLCLEKIEKEL